MSSQSPEVRHHQSLVGLAERSLNRARMWMGMAAVGGASDIGLGYYVNEKFYPLVNTLEEISRGPWGKLDPITQAGLTATLGVMVLGVVTTACLAAGAYNAFRHFRFNNQADRLRTSMMIQAGRPKQ